MSDSNLKHSKTCNAGLPTDTWQVARCTCKPESVSPPAQEVKPMNNEQLAEHYIRQSGKAVHSSDCATSKAPAEVPEPCDCNEPQTVKRYSIRCMEDEFHYGLEVEHPEGGLVNYADYTAKCDELERVRQELKTLKSQK